jgi:hypothetical protein
MVMPSRMESGIVREENTDTSNEVYSSAVMLKEKTKHGKAAGFPQRRPGF